MNAPTQHKLVPIAPCHALYIHTYLNDEKIADTYPVSLPYTMEDAKQYVLREMRGRANAFRYSFAIFYQENFAGVCALYDINQAFQSAKLYYWVASKFWKKGIASQSLATLIDFAQKELDINYLKTGVLERNLASIKVLEKNGFTIENMLINTDQYHDKFNGERVVEMQLYCDN